MVEYKGTYSQYLAARAKDEVRLDEDRRRSRTPRSSGSRRSPTRSAPRRRWRARRTTSTSAPIASAPRTSRRRRTIARLTVKLPPPPHTGRVLLEVEGVTKSYDGPPVFSDVSFALERGERLLVLGLNGAGKTSLLRILAGEALGRSRHGRVRPRRLARLLRAGARGHRRRTHAARPHARPRRSPPTSSCAACSGCSVSRGDKAFQDAGTLSGGEKTKLALAQLVAGRHNLLLLDEPTNNLDPGSRDCGRGRARVVAGRHGHREPRPRVRRASSSRAECC